MNAIGHISASRNGLDACFVAPKNLGPERIGFADMFTSKLQSFGPVSSRYHRILQKLDDNKVVEAQEAMDCAD